MKTLLSINNYHYPRDSPDILYLEHNRLFQNAGWNVVPFSMHHPENVDTPWSKHFVQEIEYGRRYSPARKLGHAARVVYSLEARRKLRQLLEAASPDIAHCHNIYHHISPSILSLLRDRGVRVVMTLHDFKISCPAYHMFLNGIHCDKCRINGRIEVLRNRCIKGSLALSSVVWLESVVHALLRTYTDCVDVFVAPSRFYIDELVRWGWPRDKFAHIPTFLDAMRYVPRYEPGTDFVYFGSLAPEKGLRTLIHATALADVSVLLVGAGPELPGLRALSKRLGARVRFLAPQSDPSLHALVRNCRATVYPAEWSESTPRAVLESWALGKPVVAARIGGISELVTADTGWLHESGAAESLAEALRLAAGCDNEVIREMGRSARTRIESEFSPQRYRRFVTGLYRHPARRERASDATSEAES